MQHFGIKTMFRGLMAGLVVLAGASVGQAASVTGTAGINVQSTTISPPGSILGATSFTFTNLTTNNSSSGDFTAGVAVDALTSSLVIATPNTFTFGSATFGTFHATAITGDAPFTLGGLTFRNITLTGTFTGGTLFPGKMSPAPATLGITLTQAGPSVSGGFVLQVAPVAVPEPASLAMLGLGVAGVLGAARLRRKAA